MAENGGPAFPVQDMRGDEHGMTLRDYFAGQAFRCVQAKDLDLSNKKERKEYAQAIAILAYEFADAMLAERGKL